MKSLSVPIKKGMVLVLLTACVVAFTVSGKGTTAGNEPGLEMRLPRLLEKWTGKPIDASPAEKKILPPDTEIVKMNYKPREPHGKVYLPVQATIVLSGKDRTSIHRPEVCLVGQGWNIQNSIRRQILLENGESLNVTSLELNRSVSEDAAPITAYYVYWFVGTDSTTPTNFQRILSTATENLIDGTNPRWAYVSVLSTGKDAIDAWIPEAVPQFQSVYQPATIF
ncbi:MAG: exosortase-associated EpsI family protein [Verrucomicrobiales bacterium]|nr:exosortase-associated EpsI family protein [Verrucomicrobiales bacterium]